MVRTKDVEKTLQDEASSDDGGQSRIDDRDVQQEIEARSAQNEFQEDKEMPDGDLVRIIMDEQET
jgi:hypothetical protein